MFPLHVLKCFPTNPINRVETPSNSLIIQIIVCCSPTVVPFFAVVPFVANSLTATFAWRHNDGEEQANRLPHRIKYCSKLPWSSNSGNAPILCQIVKLEQTISKIIFGDFHCLVVGVLWRAVYLFSCIGKLKELLNSE